MTANSTTQSVLRLLADYELTHSGEEAQSPLPLPNSRSADEVTHENPQWWPEGYNDIPQDRPVNRNLDRAERPWANLGVETAFVWTMMNGVGLVAGISKIWRWTGGRFDEKAFTFTVDGER